MCVCARDISLCIITMANITHMFWLPNTSIITIRAIGFFDASVLLFAHECMLVAEMLLLLFFFFHLLLLLNLNVAGDWRVPSERMHSPYAKTHIVANQCLNKTQAPISI